MIAAGKPRLSDDVERSRALDTRRSIIVQAPAGSGKTELLTQRFLRLLGEVDEPEQILAITFTRAATAEMRTRVLRALEAANRSAEGGEDPLSPLAQAALRNNAARGWKLLEQPHRLVIQTIDSLALAIAHNTPLLSRLGGSLAPTEDADPLYQAAARRTLARLGEGRTALAAALKTLLELRGASLSDCQKLIAGILKHRDQWGRVMLLSDEADGPEVRAALEAPLEAEHRRVLSRAHSLLAGRPDLAGELFDLLRHSCANLIDDGVDSPLLQLHKVSRMDELAGHGHWKCLCEYLLTGKGGWRERPNHVQGFRSGKESAGYKARFQSLTAALRQHPEILGTLCELRGLPPPRFSEEQWRILRDTVLVLRRAAAELRLLFAEGNQVDFVEVGLAARQALIDDRGQPSEAAGYVAGQWRHLLIDEFQDTSRSQYELLSLIAAGWESGDPGTCFLVGDPMQSIYLFRQAEVELFESTRRHGLGEGPARITLLPIALQTNFRSHAGIVDRLNAIFAAVFGGGSGGAQERGYHIPFAASTAAVPAPAGSPGVVVTPGFLRAGAGASGRLAANTAEAERVVQAIQSHCSAMQSAERAGGEFRVAVLVRAKQHLAAIAQKLRQAGIPFRAVEMEHLQERQEILDLAALARALLHPMDRIAWLSVLRAPWCGLTLGDLHILCGGDDPEASRLPVLSLLRTRLPLLTADGQSRAARVAVVMEDALRGRRRQSSFSRWLERVWITMDGHRTVDRAGYENAAVFFSALAEIPPDATQLERRIGQIFAQPDPRVSERCGVQLMTIHKAKGLGFDVVLAPGLGRGAKRDEPSLLRWLERTQLEQTGLEGTEEDERHEFLVAPIGQKSGEKDPLYEWLGRQKRIQEAEEAKRLLYVACTRARQELHLFGAAIVRTDAQGREKIKPEPGSLLETAWPALEGEYAAAWESQSREQPAAARSPAAPPRKALQLRRLPCDATPSHRAGFKSPTNTIAASASESASEEEKFVRPAGSLAARAFGIVTHALLEELAWLARDIDPQSLQEDLRAAIQSWQPRAKAMLRNAGSPYEMVESQTAEVLRALTSTVEDAVGRWILGPRANAQSESSWSAWTGAPESARVLRTLRGDRIFRAGAEPGSQQDTHLWIVDYKTSSPKGLDLETFLAAERDTYSPQLAAYAELMRKAQPDMGALRLALYYPLLKRILSWSPLT